MPLPLANRNVNIALLSVTKYDHFSDAVHLFYIDTGQSVSSNIGG